MTLGNSKTGVDSNAEDPIRSGFNGQWSWDPEFPTVTVS